VSWGEGGSDLGSGGEAGVWLAGMRIDLKQKHEILSTKHETNSNETNANVLNRLSACFCHFWLRALNLF
jgi:hypothetical protein